jgi:hypothetical protein
MGEVSTKKALPSWVELFPGGRHIYYEGDDPTGFVQEIKDKFGFDPSASESWGEMYPDDEGGEDLVNYSFDCPAHLLDQIYGGDYPMGS